MDPHSLVLMIPVKPDIHGDGQLCLLCITRGVMNTIKGILTLGEVSSRGLGEGVAVGEVVQLSRKECRQWSRVDPPRLESWLQPLLAVCSR